MNNPIIGAGNSYRKAEDMANQQKAALNALTGGQSIAHAAPPKPELVNVMDDIMTLVSELESNAAMTSDGLARLAGTFPMADTPEAPPPQDQDTVIGRLQLVRYRLDIILSMTGVNLNRLSGLV